MKLVGLMMKPQTARALLLLGLVCAIGARAATREKLVITGSSTVAPLASEIARRFEKMRPQSRVDVQSGGSSRGVMDARQGLADIGLVSRALRTDETDLTAYPIAMDGVSLIVHAQNPVNSLTNQQVVDVFTGKIKNWKEVGGADAGIIVVSKAEGRSTLELFLQFFALKNSDLRPHIIIGDNVQGIKSVTGSPNAIGYVSIGSAEAEIKSGTKLKLLPINGVPATIANVKAGKFPLSRPLNLVTKAIPASTQKAFIDFARSEKVKDLIEGQYFVPLTH